VGRVWLIVAPSERMAKATGKIGAGISETMPTFWCWTNRIGKACQLCDLQNRHLCWTDDSAQELVPTVDNDTWTESYIYIYMNIVKYRGLHIWLQNMFWNIITKTLLVLWTCGCMKDLFSIDISLWLALCDTEFNFCKFCT
jgi:hypothetical protein